MLDLILEAAPKDPLEDPLFILLIVISIIAIIASAIIGTLYGRKKRAEVESRIAERRKRRQQAKEEAAQRERNMIKRYEEAKKKAAEEVARNPRPLVPVENIPDEDYRPVPRGGGRVETISTSGPMFMKVEGDLGISGSEPMRISESGVQRVKPAKASMAQEGPSPKVAQAKAKATVTGPEPHETEPSGDGTQRVKTAVATTAPEQKDKDKSDAEVKVEAGPPKDLDDETIPSIDDDDEDQGLSELEKMMASLDDMD